MYFNNIKGLYALLALIPFIIIYLIKNKPKKQIIPSLMFLLKEKKQARKKSFFFYFLKNIIFLLQLLMIISLALAIAQPYIVTSRSVDEKNTVIVIDVSGSSQASYKGTTRFNEEIEEALKNMKGRISIILAKETPTILVEDSRPYEAKKALATLKPKATKTNLGDAMILAGDLLKGKTGTILVISDFIVNEGADVLAVKKILMEKGYNVRFIDISSKAENIGIIDAKIGKDLTEVYVKNYKDKEEIVTLSLIKNNKIRERKAGKIPGNSVETFNFETPTGISKIMIENKDDFNLDNNLYISAPEKKKIKVWLITNLKEGTTPYEEQKREYLNYDYLVNALLAMKDIELYIAKPPVIEQTAKLEKIQEINPDIIIVHKVNQNFLPGSYEIIKEQLEKGSYLIINAQENIDKIGLEDLLPVKIEGIGKNTDVKVLINNEITKDVTFTPLTKYIKATPLNNTLILVETTSNYPLLLQKENILYYGILDEGSGFKTTSSYPILWHNIIHSFVKQDNIANYNFKAGTLLSFTNEKKVITPQGPIKTKTLLLEESGIYEFDNKKIAVNMLSEEESDIAKENILTQGKDIQAKKKSEKEKLELEIPLIIFIIVLSFLELLIVKIRGDL